MSDFFPICRPFFLTFCPISRQMLSFDLLSDFLSYFFVTFCPIFLADFLSDILSDFMSDVLSDLLSDLGVVGLVQTSTFS